MQDELPAIAHVDAGSVAEAVHWLATYGDRAKVIAGGTDLLGLMKDRITGPGMPLPEVLVNVKTIPELSAIVLLADGGLALGAATTLDDLASHPVVRERYPALAQAAEAVATLQIRTVGTIGGNLCQRPWCWYFRHPAFVCFKRGGRQCFALPGEHRTYFSVLGLGVCVMSHPSDLAPALMALDARVVVAGAGGERVVPIAEFYRGPRSVSETVLGAAEIVIRVEVPPPGASARSAFLKHRVRDSWDFALAAVAVSASTSNGRCGDVRIALGGVAPFPYRAAAAEAMLRGEAVTEARMRGAAAAAVERARPLPMNGYKIELTRALVTRALTAVLS